MMCVTEHEINVEVYGFDIPFRIESGKNDVKMMRLCFLGGTMQR